jgi:hypothetical protein
MIRLVSSIAVLATCLTGCLERHKTCPLYDEGTAGIADQLLRDPSTGECESFGGPPCDSECGPCPGLTEALPPSPDWGACSGACDSLSETQCLATDSCHAAYQDDSAQFPVFWGCWDMPLNGVTHAGTCTGLDAQTCTEHDNCASVYTGPVNQPQNFVPSFERCVDEAASACTNVDCGSGKLCVLTPAAPTTPDCETPATAGTCADATCDIQGPNCPAGTTQATGTNGCYTGFCIPTTECVATACADLTTEATCLARSDCDAVYDGMNCTCDNNGCTCQTKTYSHCQ